MLVAAASAAGLVALAIPSGYWYLQYAALANLKRDLAAVKKEAGLPQYRGVIERNERLKVQEDDLAKKLQIMDELLTNQSRWIKIMEAVSFSQARATDLWLTNLTSAPSRSGGANEIELSVEGLTFSVASMDEFMSSLRNSDLQARIMPPKFEEARVAGQKAMRFTTTLKVKV